MSLPPTDLPTYYSFRLTVSHDRVSELLECVSDVSEYLIWPHKGKNGDNAHFHVAVPSPSHKYDDKVRKRITTKFGKGNGVFSGKYQTNSLSDFIHYCKHESGVPLMKGDQWERLIAEAPEYLPLAEFKKATGHIDKRREKLGDPMLTFSNVVKQALIYRTKAGLKSTDLKEVLGHMMANTDWIPSRDMMNKGLDMYHHTLFAHRCDRGFVRSLPADWMNPVESLYKYH